MSDAGSKRVHVDHKKSGDERATSTLSCRTIKGQSAKVFSLATRAASDSSSSKDDPCNTKQPPQKTSARETYAGSSPLNSRGTVRFASPKPSMIALLPSFRSEKRRVGK